MEKRSWMLMWSSFWNINGWWTSRCDIKQSPLKAYFTAASRLVTATKTYILYVFSPFLWHTMVRSIMNSAWQCLCNLFEKSWKEFRAESRGWIVNRLLNRRTLPSQFNFFTSLILTLYVQGHYLLLLFSETPKLKWVFVPINKNKSLPERCLPPWFHAREENNGNDLVVFRGLFSHHCFHCWSISQEYREQKSEDKMMRPSSGNAAFYRTICFTTSFSMNCERAPPSWKIQIDNYCVPVISSSSCRWMNRDK